MNTIKRIAAIGGAAAVMAAGAATGASADVTGSVEGIFHTGGLGVQCGSQTVTQADVTGEYDPMLGWFTPSDETAATIGADGLTFAPSHNGTALYKRVVVPLGAVDQSTLGFAATGAKQPAYQLRVLGSESGGTLGFGTIVWDGKDPKGFWLTGDGPHSGQDKKGTLKEIAAKNPNAVVVAYGLNQTRDNDATDVVATSIQFGCADVTFGA